jgi:site-specific DNA-methyltransferase (adenine-specific)
MGEEPSHRLPHAKNKPLKGHEDILLFSKGSTGHVTQSPNRMTYNPQGVVGVGIKLVRERRALIRFMGKDRCHKEGLAYEAATNYPRSILRFAKDEDHLHPTQKPLALLEWLIRTYSNDGDVILDPTMGSGSAMVAAQSVGRPSIGIERDPDFYEIARTRVFGDQAKAA